MCPTIPRTSTFPVLGAILPASFVAKAEIASWPFFGMLAKLQRTIFVDRKPNHAAAHSDDMKTRLTRGDSLILFPEGTSSDGNRTLPFKTSLFSVASLRIANRHGVERPVTVQPVSVTCIALDGMPMGAFPSFGLRLVRRHAAGAACLAAAEAGRASRYRYISTSRSMSSW